MRKLEDLRKRFNQIFEEGVASLTEVERALLAKMLAPHPMTPKDLTEEQMKIIVEKMKAAATAEGKKRQ